MKIWRHSGSVAALVLIPVILAACGRGSSVTSPVNGRLLHAADLPDMRQRNPDQLIPDAATFVQALGPESDSVLFKEPAKALPMMRATGFVRAVAEDFTGPGTFAGAVASEFSSPENAAKALDAMYQDALEPCPNDPVCSIQHVFSVSGIPGSKGQAVTPNRKFGRPFTQYRVLFRVGSIVYGVGLGGSPEFFDPGAVSQTDAFKTFRALYARVKGAAPSGLFAPTPMPS